MTILENNIEELEVNLKKEFISNFGKTEKEADEIIETINLIKYIEKKPMLYHNCFNTLALKILLELNDLFSIEYFYNNLYEDLDLDLITGDTISISVSGMQRF